jgi:opacity protein-like surface antigen
MKCLIALGAMALLANSAFATTITDPVGDASGHADVVALSGAYSQTSLFLSAQFQPGTLDPTNLAFFIGLDTDENPATGEPSQPFLFSWRLLSERFWYERCC